MDQNTVYDNPEKPAAGRSCHAGRSLALGKKIDYLPGVNELMKLLEDRGAGLLQLQ